MQRTIRQCPICKKLTIDVDKQSDVKKEDSLSGSVREKWFHDRSPQNKIVLSDETKWHTHCPIFEHVREKGNKITSLQFER